MRGYRARKAEGNKPTPRPAPVTPTDPVAALAAWAKAVLKVPPGHPLAGHPMALPDFAQDFLRGALASHDALLSTGRKNAKSAICAVLALGYLVGPLRSKGWRGAVASLNKHKASLLMKQAEQIEGASGLVGLEFKRSPYPGRIVGPDGELVILSADRGAGHAESFDLVIVDETGLFSERDRDLLAGLRSSTSAKDGRVIHLSIRGDGPFVPELIADPACYAVVHAAPDGARLDDEVAWHAANPGLGTIKSLNYMRREAARVLRTPKDQASFMSHDLNMAVDPVAEMLCSVTDWKACEVREPPPRCGPVYLGYDAGQSVSLSALACFWPEVGRLEVFAGVAAVPDLAQRGLDDGVGDLYSEAATRGDLIICGGGRSISNARFLSSVIDALGPDVQIAGFGADRFQKGETQTALDNAEIQLPVTWRGTGAAAAADGSHDVRATQRAILEGQIKTRPNPLLRRALAEARIRRDGSGNPALEKSRSRGRIDLVQAAVIAMGLAASNRTDEALPGWLEWDDGDEGDEADL